MNPLAMVAMTCVVAATTVSPAQAAGDGKAESPDPGLAAMRGLAFLEGTWEGEGWMRRGPGEPSTFASTEIIESRLDGRVLLIEGRHHGTQSGEIIHHAFAVVTHDPETDGFHFRSQLADGRAGDHHGALVDGAFVWGMDTPRGQVRYTIRVENDAWHEVGEFSSDGESWSQFFQMDLKRDGS